MNANLESALVRSLDTDYNATMTLKLDLNPELERQLRNEAASHGLTLEQLILKDLQARVMPARLNHEETTLMQTISEGFPEAFWTRYRHLIGLREQERLTDLEQAELIACSDRVEHLNAERTAALVELAKLRGQSIHTLRDELGLKPISTAA
jgi:hypothetical protein